MDGVLESRNAVRPEGAPLGGDRHSSTRSRLSASGASLLDRCPAVVPTRRTRPVLLGRAGRRRGTASHRVGVRRPADGCEPRLAATARVRGGTRRATDGAALAIGVSRRDRCAARWACAAVRVVLFGVGDWADGPRSQPALARAAEMHELVPARFGRDAAGHGSVASRPRSGREQRRARRGLIDARRAPSTRRGHGLGDRDCPKPPIGRCPTVDIVVLDTASVGCRRLAPRAAFGSGVRV